MKAGASPRKAKFMTAASRNTHKPLLPAQSSSRAGIKVPNVPRTEKKSTTSASSGTHVPLLPAVSSRTADVGKASKATSHNVQKLPVSKPVKIYTRISDNVAAQNNLERPGNATTSTVGTEDIVEGAVKKTKANCLLVNPRQRGNPILKFVRNVPWEFDGDLIADYKMGQTTCALYLSLKYHNLNPDYIHERLKQLGKQYELRVLLTQVDVKDPHHSLKELAKICLMANCTLLLAFSPEEAGRYLETYKAYEVKPPDAIMEKTEGDYMSRLTDCLTTVKSVNKTDAMTLISNFGSIENIINTSEEELSFCPGLGPQKAQRLHALFHEPFLKSKKRKLTQDKSDPNV
ncbi:DNA excision repair protein ERCC-1-like [Lingula anatina]|uniref:DNA excision repair protein ERCC-1 n=1 Tax=Lingula anatina TaxID=7574 RepID=A0A1S3JP97_LINAN|nr:DNA excision repair protein ERCC-1-like [Lingula anatina]|eukprot:XP_013412183.1 DNA excision repair protein ERCC-1-like [Lingula anatina]